jgi:hypothetical protein
MNASELRIGNFILNGAEKIITVSSETIIDVILKYIGALPIILTDDWLIKFGFKKAIGYYIECSPGNNLEIGFNNDTSETQWYCYFRNKNNDTDDFVLLRKDLKYVHQLQNLHFSLTGKELNLINNDKN